MSTYGYDSPGGSARGGESGEAPGPHPGPGPAPASPRLVGPHAPQQADPTAVLGRRTVAWVVDAVLFTLLVFLFSFLGPFGSYAPIPEGMTGAEACEIVRDQEGLNTCFPLEEGMLGASQDRAYYIPDLVALLAMMAAVAWFVLIYVVWQGAAGATPGKWLLKVRVVDESGLPPGLGRSAGRSLLWIADAAPYVVPLVGLVTALMSTGHRRVGDMAARTYVVGLDHVGVPVQIPGEAPSAPALQYESPVPGMPAAGPAPGPGSTGYPAPPPPAFPLAPAPSEPSAPSPPAFVPAPSPADVPGPPPGNEPTSLPPFDPATDAPSSAAPAGPSGSTEEPSPPGTPFAALSSWPERAPVPEPTQPPPAASEPTAPPPAASELTQPAPAEPASAVEPQAPDVPEETAQPVIPVEPTRPPIEAEPAQASVSAPAPQPAVQPPAEDASQPGQEPEPEQADEPVYQPQWDAARDAYIQWDPDRGSWLQWDDAAQQWHRI